MKKITLTMILLAVTVLLTAALVSCSCGDDSPAVTSTEGSSSVTEGSDSAPDTTVGKTPAVTDNNSTVITTAGSVEGTAPNSTSTKVPGTTTPDSTTGSVSTDSNGTASTGKVPAAPVAPSTKKADESGKISVTLSDIKSGLLLDINEDHKYDTDVNPLFTGDYTTTVDDAKKAGYTHISSMFMAVDNNHFLRTEAIEALAAMIQSFDAVAGTDKPFRVEGYKFELVYSFPGAHATGNVVNIRTLIDGSTYGLNYLGHRVLLDGEMVTYDKWFEANAAKYGFIYEGLAGGPDTHSGQLRYVGTIHSSGIKEAGSLTAYIDAIKAGTVTSAVVGEDTWKLSYVKLSQGESIEHYTEIVVGANATYTISGDNKEGVIVAVKVEAEK